MKNKKHNLPKEASSKTRGLGIPTFSRVEKLTEVIPIKVGSTLKKAIPKPQSTWIRQAIIEKFQRMEEEDY